MAEADEVTLMSQRIRQKAKNLPDVIDRKTTIRCRKKARVEYLNDLKNMGVEDPANVPPYEFLQRKCVL